jgi:hypothetical protein
MSTSPIVCLLTPGEYQERLRWIADLNRDFLRSSSQDGLTLELSYNVAATGAVRELVDRERRCCPFLTFELQESSHCVKVVITAPEEARAAAEALFEQLRAR